MVVTPENAPAKIIDFPGKDPAEEFQFYFHQHTIRMVHVGSRLFLWVAAFLATVYFSGVFSMQDETTRRVVGVLLVAFFVIPQLAFIIRLYRHFLYLAVVTDRKVHIFKRSLVSVDQHESVDLSVLQDIKKQQRGLVQNMFGFGTLTLEAQYSTLVLHFTPGIDRVYHSILGLRERARNGHVAQPALPLS